MLFRQLRTSQVKCNFCLQWMTLSVDVKFSINVCDACLLKGCQDNSLKAVASTGQVYQLYMTKQNSPYQLQTHSKTIDSPFKVNESQNNIDNFEFSSEKAQLLQKVDEKRNIEIKQILQKWATLSQFLNQKQSLSKQQIDYLKGIIYQKVTDFEKLDNLELNHAPFHENQLKPITNEFQIHSQQANIQQQSITAESFKNLNIPLININITDKQNLHSKSITKTKRKLNTQTSKQRTPFKSPTKNLLKEKDFNTLHASLIKLSDLRQNHHTSHINFFNENSSLSSSYRKKSFAMFQSSERFSSKSSMISSFMQQLNDQELKKYEQAKQKIIKYLQKTCGSNSLTRLMLSVVFEAFSNTTTDGKSLQLISYNLSFIDFRCYLEAFDWTGIEVLKLVKTKLTDSQLKILVEFILSQKLSIKVLVLTGNKLTESSIEYLNERELDCVREIYLGRNSINKCRVREEIKSLGIKYSLYL